jgi:hypothetical protein
MPRDWNSSGRATYDDGYGPKPHLEAGLREAMRGVIDDAINRPNAMNPNHAREIPPYESRAIEERRQAAAKQAALSDGMMRVGGGWAKEVPLSLPIEPGSFSDRVVGGVIDAATLSPEERIKRDLKALGPEQRQQLMKEIAASADPRAAQLKALTEEAWA